MIINTEKLKKAIRCRDDDADWEKMPMRSLDYMEKRCIDDLNLVDKIESLVNELKTVKPSSVHISE